MGPFETGSGERQMMKHKPPAGIGWISLIVLTAVLSGCAAVSGNGAAGPPAINTDTLIADLTPDIETLYLSWHELDQTYRDIKYLERGFLFDADDRQLGYVQKAGLYVQDASVRIHHQWEMLSVLHYIRPEMLRDYLTLMVRDLTAAIEEIGYDDMFLTIYTPFIASDAVIADLNRAQESMKKNAGVLKQILEKLSPLANAAVPPTSL
jgi:hypothetical protein